jgi:hypothetical protein
MNSGQRNCLSWALGRVGVSTQSAFWALPALAMFMGSKMPFVPLFLDKNNKKKFSIFENICYLKFTVITVSPHNYF